jgi:hypothetical protein
VSGHVPQPHGRMPAVCDEGSAGAEPHRDDDGGVTSRRGADWTGGRQSHSCTVLSLLPPARHLGYGFLSIPRVDLATIAAGRHRQEAARILRDEMYNRSDDGNPPLERSERTEQILASRGSLPPKKSAR